MTHSLNSSYKSVAIEEIPVLLTMFNRPDKTRAVIASLRLIKPKLLFIAADGPRPTHSADTEKCRLAREETALIDWPCEIKTRFLDDNQGCDAAIPSAIDWFFEQVEYGIIVEDDCILSPDFFALCGDLFMRFADDLRIMQISSVSPYAAREHQYDYHFSRMSRCHGGWATWRRAWSHYTSDLRSFSDQEALAILKASQPDYSTIAWQYHTLLKYKKGSSYFWRHWDFKWNLISAAHNGLCVVPEKNLLINIGFDEDSTNTVETNPVLDNLRHEPISFPLRHPPFMYADRRPERSLEKKIYRSLPVKSRYMYVLRRLSGACDYLREILPFG